MLVFAVLGSAGCVPLQLPDPAIRYIAFGDSTTAGPAEADYVDFVADRLNLPIEQFANEGESGEPTEDGLTRLQFILETGLYPNAQVLFYWQGGIDITRFIRENDALLIGDPDDPDGAPAQALAQTLDEVQSNLESVIALAHEHGLTPYLATYYPVVPGFFDCDPVPLDTLLPSQAENANVYIDRLNDRIRQAAVNANAEVVDVASLGDALTADADNYYNCNHLSGDGNMLVAELFAQTLEGSP